MLALAVAAFITVQSGNTLSGISAAHGVSLSQIEADNPQVTNPNVIYAGEQISISSGYHTTEVPAVQQAPAQPVQQAPAVSTPAPVQSGGGGGSYQACVRSHESGGQSQVMNGSGHYGLYQFSATAWAAAGGNPADFGHASVAEQNQAFHSLYSQLGTSPWAGDGCTG